MPKGKAKERQAGTSAVPTARAPAFTPPDAAAHAKYKQLVATFSRAFQQAGVEKEGLYSLWAECCRYSGSEQSRAALGAFIGWFLSNEKGVRSQQASDLVSAFMQRTLVIAGIHEHLFQNLIRKKAFDGDASMCICLLQQVMQGCIFPGEIPDECQPDTSQSYATLAHMHWHPRCIEIASQALLLNLHPNLHYAITRFLRCLLAPEGESSASPSWPATATKVLQDRPCMSAIWGLMQQAEHSQLGVHIIAQLLTEHDSPRAIPHLFSFSYFLSIGAAPPLTYALNHHCKRHELEQQQGQQQQQEEGMPKPLSTVILLLSIVQRAVLNEAEENTNLQQPTHTQAARPIDLLQAHLRGLTKVVQEVLPPKGVPNSACGLDYGVYPQASLPQIAHALINDPAMLSALVHFIKICAAGIPTHWKQPTERCHDAIKLILDLLAVNDDILRQLPLHQLGTCAINAIVHAGAEVQHLSEHPCSGSSGNGACENANTVSSCFDLAEVAVDLLLALSELPGGDDLAKVLSPQQDESIPWRAAVQTPSERQWFDAAAKEALSVMVDAASRCAQGLRVSDAAGSAGGGAPQGSGVGDGDLTCANCGRGGKLKVCGRCKAAWFCGASCQRSAWSSHKLVCAPPKGAAVP